MRIEKQVKMIGNRTKVISNDIYEQYYKIKSTIQFYLQMQVFLQEQSLGRRITQLTKDPKILRSVIKIQRAWRSISNKKKLKKMIKRMKSKQQIAKQLLMTQRAYCQHMCFILRQVVIPSIPVIDDKQLHTIIFSNLEQIYSMHEGFLKGLQKVMEKYSHHKTKISTVIYNELFGMENFKLRYSNYCANYKKSNKMAKLLFSTNTSFINLAKKAKINDSKELQSFLIKPMQRLCKYQLLLNNYFKNMETNHEDYNSMKQTITFVQNLVKETNEQVEQFLFAEKFKQLQYQFEQIFEKNPNPNRKLLFHNQQISLIDLINDQSCLYQEINLFNDSVFLVPVPGSKHIFSPIYIYKDLPNLKYYKNLVQLIHNDRYLTIQFKSDKRKQMFLDALHKTDAPKDNDFIQVTIRGTQSRQSVFKNFTVYIVELKFSKESVRKIYPRFKDLLRVQQILDSNKIKLNLPSLSKQGIFKTTKSKTIEKRKLIIQQFLQKILNCKDCYEIIEIFKVLNLVMEQNIKNVQTQIKINLPNSQQIKIKIDVKTSKISELKQKIAQTIGLSYSTQFQIYEVRNKVTRLMHDDQPVSQIDQNQNKFSLNPFKQEISYVYTRHYYLNTEEEFVLYKNDFTRTQLQLSVIKSKILTYNLQQELMITFMCLFALYTSLTFEDDQKLNAFIKDICKKQYKINKQEFRQYLVQVQKKVTSQDDELITLPFLIIKIMNNSPLYTCKQFEVIVHHKCFKSVKGYIAGLQQKIIIGVKKTQVLMLKCQSKQILHTFQMDMIQLKELHPTAIVLHISNIGPALRLITQSAYQISRLFQIYQRKQKKALNV